MFFRIANKCDSNMRLSRNTNRKHIYVWSSSNINMHIEKFHLSINQSITTLTTCLPHFFWAGPERKGACFSWDLFQTNIWHHRNQHWQHMEESGLSRDKPVLACTWKTNLKNIIKCHSQWNNSILFTNSSEN
jgi:hypothetical protein